MRKRISKEPGTTPHTMPWRARTAQVAVGGLLLSSGLLTLAMASGGTAMAATYSPNGSTLGNPISVSASIPEAITVNIGGGQGANSLSFGAIQPGSSGTQAITDTVTSNDASGYTTDIIGTNQGAGYANNMSATCNESVPDAVVNGSTMSAITTYGVPGGYSRPASNWSQEQVDSAGVLNASDNAVMVATPTAGNTLTQGEAYNASLMSVAFLKIVGSDTFTASSPQFNQGLVSAECSASPVTSNQITDTFSLSALPWAAITAQGNGAATAFAEQDGEGSFTDSSGNYTLDTQPVVLDSKNTVSGTAGSLTNTSDTYTDHISISVPANQPAGGNYEGDLVECIWGS